MYWFKTAYKSILFILLIVVLGSHTACKQNTEKRRDLTPQQLKEPLIRANIAAKDTEEQQIDDFIARYNWPMKSTGSGLRYFIYRNGEGPQGKEGQTAVINYELRSISGNIIYTSDESGPMEFLIGKGGVESGLEEAILLMRIGDRAKIIIPSHLGFGLAGDDHKIPPKATLIYDIEVLEIK